MTQPAQIILDLLGATPENARLSNSVLVIIDAQREYVDGALPLAGINEALVVGGELLQRARAATTPVVHVLHRGGGPLFDPQGLGFQPAAPLIPQAGEAVVEKTMTQRFHRYRAAGNTLPQAGARTSSSSVFMTLQLRQFDRYAPRARKATPAPSSPRRPPRATCLTDAAARSRRRRCRRFALSA